MPIDKLYLNNFRDIKKALVVHYSVNVFLIVIIQLGSF